MTYEEWQGTTRLMLDFYSLAPAQREQVMLIMDGLKYRAALSHEEQKDG